MYITTKIKYNIPFWKRHDPRVESKINISKNHLKYNLHSQKHTDDDTSFFKCKILLQVMHT